MSDVAYVTTPHKRDLVRFGSRFELRIFLHALLRCRDHGVIDRIVLLIRVGTQKREHQHLGSSITHVCTLLIRGASPRRVGGFVRDSLELGILTDVSVKGWVGGSVE